MALPRLTCSAALACAALLLTACSGTPAASPSSAGPLEEFLAGAAGDYDDEDANRDMQRVEELVAQCMADQGFDYTPADPGQGSLIVSTDDDPEIEWGTQEFAEQYGYGLTTDPWGGQTEPDPEDMQEFVDPNQDYIDSMSETEQQAYFAALYGDMTEYEEPAEGEEYEYHWEDAGCQGYAQHEVFDNGGALDPEQFQSLWDDMDAMWQSVQDDPRLGEANATWSSCMADAGHPGLATPDDAQTEISDQVNALWEDAYGDLDSENATEEDWAAAEDAAQAAQADLTAAEIAMATADFGCRAEAQIDDIQRTVQNEYEQEFVDSHRADLEAYKAAMAEQNA